MRLSSYSTLECFLGKFDPKNWSLVQGYIAICLLQFYCLFFQNSFCSYFFWQIWSQIWSSLSKLTEILYRGTLLYAYYNFNVYFFKILFIHIFWLKFGPKIWSSLNWQKFCTGVHCCLLITILMFIFSKFFSFIFFCGKCGPKI